jgi:hypothetical protein
MLLQRDRLWLVSHAGTASRADVVLANRLAACSRSEPLATRYRLVPSRDACPR